MITVTLSNVTAGHWYSLLSHNMAAGGEKKIWMENFRKFLSFKTVSDQKSRTDVNVVLDQLNAAACTVNLTAEQNVINFCY